MSISPMEDSMIFSLMSELRRGCSVPFGTLKSIVSNFLRISVVEYSREARMLISMSSSRVLLVNLVAVILCQIRIGIRIRLSMY